MEGHYTPNNNIDLIDANIHDVTKDSQHDFSVTACFMRHWEHS